MPIYCYETIDGRIHERVFPIGQAPNKINVGRHLARRSFVAERKSVPSTRGWPMECVASGVNAEDAGKLRDHLAKCGVPTEVSNDGNPIYISADHRRRALKARGMHDKNSYI